MLLNDLPKGVVQDIRSLNDIIVGNKKIVPIEQKNQHMEELRGRICSIVLSLLLEKYRKNPVLLSKEISRDQIHDMNHLIEMEEGDKIPLLLEDRFNCARTLKAKI